MILFLLIWIIPILLIVRLKWVNMKSGTIKDLLKTHVNPTCKECDCCDDEYFSWDWVVLIPVAGLIMILWTYLSDPIQKLLNKKIK